MDYVPERIKKADNILNKFMLSFNIAVPVIYGISQFVNNLLGIEFLRFPGWIRYTNRVLNISAVLLQLISGLFLFWALLKIK
jgi:hypothetical protein